MEQLKKGQKVIFTIKDTDYIYTVCTEYLIIQEQSRNDKIFEDLGLNKIKFCSDCYGYDQNGGDWPESKFGDFAALTRLVEALFPYCDKVTVDRNIVYSKSEKTIFKEPESFISSSKSKFSDIIDFESIVQITKIKLTFI